MNIVLYPEAKINLGLRIVGRRQDGYHDLETLFYPVKTVKDILEIIESDHLSVHYHGRPVDLPGGDIEKELCVKAFRLMEKEFGIPPVSIHLYKQIPSGAGLGGGSSDAASTLYGLNAIFRLGLSAERLAGLARQIGSDCPFFLHDGPMFGEGRGEILSPFRNSETERIEKEHTIRIIESDIRISTAEAYSGILPDPSGKGLKKLLDQPLEKWKNCITNDFEESVFRKYPELEKTKERLYEEGAVYAAMSGSGSALFGIF